MTPLLEITIGLGFTTILSLSAWLAERAWRRECQKDAAFWRERYHERDEDPPSP